MGDSQTVPVKPNGQMHFNSVDDRRTHVPLFSQLDWAHDTVTFGDESTLPPTGAVVTVDVRPTVDAVPLTTSTTSTKSTVDDVSAGEAVAFRLADNAC
jgi:hypothetical protein